MTDDQHEPTEPLAEADGTEQVAEVVRQFLSFIWERRDNLVAGWGRSDVREEFEARAVARRFHEVLMELV